MGRRAREDERLHKHNPAVEGRQICVPLKRNLRAPQASRAAAASFVTEARRGAGEEGCDRKKTTTATEEPQRGARRRGAPRRVEPAEAPNLGVGASLTDRRLEWLEAHTRHYDLVAHAPVVAWACARTNLLHVYTPTSTCMHVRLWCRRFITHERLRNRMNMR